MVVQASDGTLTDTQTINVTVTNQNEAPVITSNGGGASASRSVVENATAVTTVTAFDPDGVATPLTFSIVGGSDQSLFTINPTTGALAFVSGRDFETPTDANGDNVYNVTVRASDGANVDTQDIKVTVTNRNDAPVITSNGGGVSASITRAENGPLLVTTVIATDQDAGAALSYMISGGVDAARFSINAATGQLSFVSNPDFEAPADSNGDNRYIVIVRASDGALTDVQTITVIITDVGESSIPPSITSNGGGPTATVSVGENTNAVTTVAATDGDTPPTGLSYSIAGGADAGQFTINATTGLLSFISPNDFESPDDSGLDGVYDVIVRVSDGANFDTQAIAVTVTNANEAPVITSGGGGPGATVNYAENLNPPFITTLTASDPDAGATLTFSIAGGADAALFFISASGSLGFVSPRDFETPTDADLDGVYEVLVQVSDGTLIDTQAVAVTVTNVDEAPDILSDGGGPTATIDVLENQIYVTDVVADEPEGQSVTYSIVGGVDGALFTIDPATGLLTFGTPPDFESPQDSDGDNRYEVLVRASDGINFSEQQIVARVQNDPAEPTGPTLTELIGIVTTNEGDPRVRIDANVTFTTSETDFNGATLRVNGLNGTDQVSVINFGGGTGQVGATAGSSITVSYEGVVIGIGIGGVGSDLNIIFNGNATRQAIEAVVEALGYQSVADDTVANHSLTITLTDPLAQEASASVRLVFIANVLNGSPNPDALAGFSGDDTINGFGGADELDGGVGDDIIHGGTGDDVIDGNQGQDFLYGGDGFDVLNGNEDNDHIYGGLGIDSIDGGAGDDVLFGDEGNDIIFTGDGFNLVFGGADSDLVYGGVDVDILHGDGGDDELHGFDGNDQMHGDAGADSLDGEVGDDSLEGGDGDDTLRGGADIDFLSGDAGVDDLDGGAGDDTLRGGDDNDVLIGGDGDDKVFGEGGDDTIQGGDGDTDIIDGGGDRLVDIDTVFYANPLSAYTLAFGTNNDIFVTGPGGFVDHLFNIEFLQFSDLIIQVGNDVPGITFGGGGEQASISVDENETFIAFITASDTDVNAVLSFAILDSADSGSFQIDSSTGELTFSIPPDFEAPSDSDGDNIYAVEVLVSDGISEDRQTIFVTVNDVAGGIIPAPKGDDAPMAAPSVMPPPVVEVPTGVEAGWLF